eukprot:4465240-Lingulodinium_polyedra.AAC.1
MSARRVAGERGRNSIPSPQRCASRNPCALRARRHTAASAWRVRVAKCAAPQRWNGVSAAFPSRSARA